MKYTDKKGTKIYRSVDELLSLKDGIRYDKNGEVTEEETNQYDKLIKKIVSNYMKSLDENEQPNSELVAIIKSHKIEYK